MDIFWLTFHIEVGKVSFIAKGEGKLPLCRRKSEEALNENTKPSNNIPLNPIP